MLYTSLRKALPLLASLVTFVQAQTFTSCNPLNGTGCPLDTALGRANYSINFDNEIMTTRVWNTTAGAVNYGDLGAEFTIQQRGDSPTVQTKFYLFFGQVEVIMRAATGQGIISSIVLESDDLDEVDWEFMGGNSSFVETNYFGKGNTTSFDRALYYPVDNPQENYHNYTTQWTSEKLEWFIDGQLVRTLMYGDANGGNNFPQTPMNLRLGVWAGGDPKEPNGTIQWAGGETDYNNCPFTMYVQSVRVTDFSNATQYKYGDTSGDWQSIQLLNDASPLKLDGNNDPSAGQTLSQRWKGLSKTTKIAIMASVFGVIGIGLLVFLVCFFKQRRVGKREKALDDAAYEKQRAEVLAYRSAMANRPRGPNSSESYSMHKTPSVSAMSVASNHTGPYANDQYAHSVRSFTGNNGYVGAAAPPMPMMSPGYGQAPYGAGGRGYQKY